MERLYSDDERPNVYVFDAAPVAGADVDFKDRPVSIDVDLFRNHGV